MTTQAVTPFQNGNSVAETRPSELRREYTTQDVEAMKSTFAKDLTQAEARVVIEYARRTGLDPITKEVHVWKDNKGLHITPGIDGYRRRAMESGKFEGMELDYCGKDGQWTPDWFGDKPPFAARCIIYRKGFRTPFRFVALWSDFYRNMDTWNQRGTHMLGVAAQRHCFRMSFPQEFASLFDAIPPEYRGRVDVDVAEDDDYQDPEPGAVNAIAAPANVDQSTGEIIDTEPAETSSSAPSDEAPKQEAEPSGDPTVDAIASLLADAGEDGLAAKDLLRALTMAGTKGLTLAKLTALIEGTPERFVLAQGQVWLAPPEAPDDAEAIDMLPDSADDLNAAPEPAEPAPKAEPFPAADDWKTPASACYGKVRQWAAEHKTDPNRLRFYMATAAGVPATLTEGAFKAWLDDQPGRDFDQLYVLYVDGERNHNAAPETPAKQGAFA